MHDVSAALPGPAGSHASTSRSTRALRCFAWDLTDIDLEELIAGLRETGIDGLHLSLLSHGGRFYCPHHPKHALVHAPDGLLYFQPSSQIYESIRPRVHPEYGSGTLVRRARELCRDYDMACVAWVALFNNQTISTWHPEATCVNALGDRLEGMLCPAHADVRAYAQGILRDAVDQMDPDAIELEDFAYPALNNFAGREWRGIETGPGLNFLLSLCFCPHCRQRAEDADIEVNNLARLVERMIRSGLSGDLSERRLNDEISDPAHPLGRYSVLRAETITSLLDELLESTVEKGTRLQPILTEEPDFAWRNGVELRELRRRAQRATIAAPFLPAAGLQSFFERYEDVLQMEQDIAVDLCAGTLSRATLPDSRFDIPAVIHAAHVSGYDRLILSHYGLVSAEFLEWLCAAARPS